MQKLKILEALESNERIISMFKETGKFHEDTKFFRGDVIHHKHYGDGAVDWSDFDGVPSKFGFLLERFAYTVGFPECLPINTDNVGGFGRFFNSRGELYVSTEWYQTHDLTYYLGEIEDQIEELKRFENVPFNLEFPGKEERQTRRNYFKKMIKHWNIVKISCLEESDPDYSLGLNFDTLQHLIKACEYRVKALQCFCNSSSSSYPEQEQNQPKINEAIYYLALRNRVEEELPKITQGHIYYSIEELVGLVKTYHPATSLARKLAVSSNLPSGHFPAEWKYEVLFPALTDMARKYYSQFILPTMEAEDAGEAGDDFLVLATRSCEDSFLALVHVLISLDMVLINIDDDREDKLWPLISKKDLFRHPDVCQSEVPLEAMLEMISRVIV